MRAGQHAETRIDYLLLNNKARERWEGTEVCSEIDLNSDHHLLTANFTTTTPRKPMLDYTRTTRI